MNIFVVIGCGERMEAQFLMTQSDAAVTKG